MKDFDLRKYLAEGKLLKEEVDVNKILSDGNYDEIDDEKLLAQVRKQLPKELNLASLLNLFVMKIEDEEGGNIDFSEGKLLKEGLKLEQNPFDQQGLFLSNDGGRSGVFITTDLDFDITDYEMDGDEERGDLNGMDVRIISVYG